LCRAIFRVYPRNRRIKENNFPPIFRIVPNHWRMLRLSGIRIPIGREDGKTGACSPGRRLRFCKYGFKS